MYTHNQDDHGARCWMPTVDHVGERCSWELEITVASGLVAVASGELLEQVCLFISFLNDYYHC